MQTRKSAPRGSSSQASAFEASPIITDIPPLPFTTPTVKTSPRSTTKSPLKPVKTPEQQRCCEFCNKVANVCVLMHCTACGRVYHAQCLVNAFKSDVDRHLPIQQQMSHLQLDTPDRRGRIFRCCSCKAAFMDFYDSGGYLWDCTCPTCVEPDELLLYRKRKLLRMLGEMGFSNNHTKGGNKTRLATEPSCSGSSVELQADFDEPMGQEDQQQTSLFSTDVNELAAEVGELKMEPQPSQPDAVAAEEKVKVELSGEQSRDMSAALQQGILALNVTGRTEELQGDQLVAAVLVRGENNGRWSFPVVCSRTATAGSSVKTGLYVWHCARRGVIRCDCCGHSFSCAWFVHHSDSSLISNSSAAECTAVPFLFVKHKDKQTCTPLDPFLSAWRASYLRRSTQPPIKHEPGVVVKQETMPSTATTTSTLSLALARLGEVSIFKRPRNQRGKFTLPPRSNDPSSMGFLAQVVCLSPKYVITMVDGSLADAVVRANVSSWWHAFPRKVGWLGFNRKPFMSFTISCKCCNVLFDFDGFAAHAAVSSTKKTNTSGQFLYVLKTLDVSVLIPYSTFMADLQLAAEHNALDAILDQLDVAVGSEQPF